MFVLMVTGSRTWTDDRVIRDHITALHDTHPIMQMIHGGCRGVDYMAGEVAGDLGIPVRVFHAQWRNGRHAGPLRTDQMLDFGPDMVLAFRADGRSPGTDHAITEARKRGIPCEVIHHD